MKNKMRVADYVAQRTAEAGAKHVFLVTGGGAMHLNDAFSRNLKLKAIYFHHEQSAAMAAEAYFRLTNRIAVVNVTTGPGGVNALNGVYGAYTDSLGMLVISGQVKRETYLRNYKIPLRQLGDQEIDIVSMVEKIVKYSITVKNPSQMGEVMDKAIFLTTHGRPGPVWIDIPVDIQGALIKPSELKRFDGSLSKLISDKHVSSNTKLELINANNEIKKEHINLILKKLKNAKRPVLFVGAGIRISEMYPDFLSLIDKLKIPVVTGWNAHDTLTNDSRYFAGRPGTVGDRAGNFSVQNADFLLILGSRLNIRQISYNWKSFAQKAWKVMVDIDRAELDKPTLNIDLKINSNLKKFIPSLNRALGSYKSSKDHALYLSWCRERVLSYPTVLPSYKNKKKFINPYLFIDCLFKDLLRNDVIVTGNGSACVITFQAANLKKGQRLFTNSGSASMGYDLPAAIGVAIASKAKRVICITGDGSIMMNLQELQTIKHYNLPIKIIILNNNGYASIKQTQTSYFSDNISGVDSRTGISFPDFVAMGHALKIPSLKIRSLNDWDSRETKKLMESNSSSLFEVYVDPNQGFSPKLASQKLKDGTMISPSLENMVPFLSKEELSKNLFDEV
jgi:acetolactate synthase-1/2/3 large subunit